MRISAKTDYACKALLELSLHWPNNTPLHIKDIAKKQNIPIRYLVQILIQLKQLGHVVSVRGKEGGYQLASSPNNLNLGVVLRELGVALMAPQPKKHADKSDVLGLIWQRLDQSVSEMVNQLTFGDLIEMSKKAKGVLAYQI